MSKKPRAKLCFRKRSGQISKVLWGKLVLLKVSIISKVSITSKFVYHLKVSIKKLVLKKSVSLKVSTI